jgi:cyclase
MTTARPAYYSVQSVGDGICAALAERAGHAICNSGIVDLGDGCAVFDTGLTPQAGRELRAATEQALRRPPTIVVSSHWHLDHTLGNQEFAKLPIWGTRRTREIFLEMQDELKAQITREVLEKEARDLEARRPQMRTTDTQTDLEFMLQIDRALIASVGVIQFTAPNQTFETRLKLPGNRPAELMSFGKGHTEADAILFLARERVLFAGDLVVVGIQPSLPSGDPRHWLEVLDEIDRLKPERIVPGHGPVAPGDATHDVRTYLTSILKAAESPQGASLPAPLRRWEGSVSFEENLKFVRGWVAKPENAH